jgi:osmotically-inducible protein OsmY
MSPMSRAASSIAAIATIFAVIACDRGSDQTADTAAGTVGATTAATAAPDADRVDNRVEVALSTDSTLRPFGLDADEDDGRVVLKGAVRSEDQKSKAMQVATGVASGVTVDNRIRVDANARMSDNPIDVDEVEEQVEKALRDDATLRTFKLDVNEDNGQIVLEGTVTNAEQKTLAEQIAKRIAGTVTVVNNVKVG